MVHKLFGLFALGSSGCVVLQERFAGHETNWLLLGLEIVNIKIRTNIKIKQLDASAYELTSTRKIPELLESSHKIIRPVAHNFSCGSMDNTQNCSVRRHLADVCNVID